MILINSSTKNTNKIFQPFYPVHPPIGIGYLLTAAQKNGIDAYYIDEQVEDNVMGRINSYLPKLKRPYIFGFSVVTSALKNAINVSEQLKKLYPDSFIVFGGVHPTLVPDEILSYQHIDAVVRNDGDLSLIELYNCIKKSSDFTHIKGLSYKRDGKTVHNEEREIMSNLDAYPPFPYHLFGNPKYSMGFVLSSRGCPHQCIFCSCRFMSGGEQV